MKQFGVLVVDDSAFMRRAISQLLEASPQFFVLGIARNGLEAVEKVQRLRPDLVTMDVEMPEMNGLQALEQIMKSTPVPVVMLSSLTGEGARETIKALELGAVDFFLKENLIKNHDDKELTQEFLQRLKGIAEAKKLPVSRPKAVPHVNVPRKITNKKMELLFIGCSTGGPSALQTILPRFSKDFPIPIVVAQHMPAGFTRPLAERFNNLCQLSVKEVQSGESLKAGTIYISPSGFQTRFEKNPDGTVVFKVDNHEPVKSLYKPCIDISLTSAAPIYGERMLSVILTGMGNDGMKGCGLVKQHRGSVFVEAEESCIVYGMPRSVQDAGYADGQFLLSKMYEEIVSFIC